MVRSDLIRLWTMKQQEWTSDEKTYREDDVIKGRIGFECTQEPTYSQSARVATVLIVKQEFLYKVVGP